jgi:hypothetical protein
MGIFAKETVSRNDDAKKDAAASFFSLKLKNRGVYEENCPFST